MKEKNSTSKESNRDFILTRVIMILATIVFLFYVITFYSLSLEGNNILYFYSIILFLNGLFIVTNFKNISRFFVSIIKLTFWGILVCFTYDIVSKIPYSYEIIQNMTRRLEQNSFLKFLYTNEPLRITSSLLQILCIPWLLLTAIEFLINKIFEILKRYKIIKSRE